jgi:hypothetical protein
MAQAQMSAQQIAQQNYINRQNLIQTGLHMIKQLQPVTGNLGGSIRIPLERMGIMTGIVLDVSIPVTVTAAATPSPFGPYNTLNSVTYTDYAGVNRVLTSGYQLHALNCFRSSRTMNNSQKMAGYLTGAETGIDTNILKVPTAIATDTINFSLYIPIAYDAMSDLRGAVLSQTIYGDHYVTLQLPANLVGADGLVFPYTAGTMTLQAGQQVTVNAYQHYIMPQNGVANLPMIDLSTIYAVEGNYSDTSNIAAGQSKYINWPNNRAIMSAMHVYDNGGAGTLNGADLSRIVLLGNSNTNIREMSPKYLRNQMRYALGADLPSGVYNLSSRSQPITTQLYGNVQTKFDIVTANAGAYFLSQFESTYMAGTPLPGVIQ